MRDIFDPLFDLQDARLKKLGNPFEELQHLINWEIFRPELDKLYKKERKSNAGAKPKDVVMMFKGLVVQNLYGLSDEQLEYQLEDRRSFQRFLGLNKHERAPDAKTFWVFREKLTQLNLIENVFKAFFQQLNQAGYTTYMKKPLSYRFLTKSLLLFFNPLLSFLQYFGRLFSLSTNFRANTKSNHPCVFYKLMLWPELS